MAHFNTYISLFAKADNERCTKSIRCIALDHFFQKRLTFREESDNSGYRDKYAEVSREVLLALLYEYSAKYETLEHIVKQTNEIIAEIESDSTAYEKYQIHLSESTLGV